MAAAFLNHLGQRKAKGESAGTLPSDRVNPAIVEVMMERGLDLSQNRPKLVNGFEVIFSLKRLSEAI